MPLSLTGCLGAEQVGIRGGVDECVGPGGVAGAAGRSRLRSMSAKRARVVVTHWVHPEIGAYLAGFCDAVMPTRYTRRSVRSWLAAGGCGW
jgi:hypothetical protein